ncbi:chromosome partitioning protein [Candidatus Nitromaritima sp. SCGC AAA799-C22]|nr:chromosome partitioning protein [Candidatus Nitromaritima sp. SCGC AAA799-C22]
MKIITLFNNKGGVGKTTLAYHLANMLAGVGYSTLAVDLDPQANLTTSFFEEEFLEEIWDGSSGDKTVYDAVLPIQEGTGDIALSYPLEVNENLHVVCGDLRLSLFEDKLSSVWPYCYQGSDIGALRATTAFYRIIRESGQKVDAEIAIVDVGPNLGAINRATLLASEYLVVPLTADIFSLQGLRNLGSTLVMWRKNWQTICENNPGVDFQIPSGTMEPLGYVIHQQAVRLDRPVKAYERWLEKIPLEYDRSVLKNNKLFGSAPQSDPNCLATLRHYRSLIPLAQEAHKPVFDLKPADGVFGGHVNLVNQSKREFEDLVRAIVERIGIEIVSPLL